MCLPWGPRNLHWGEHVLATSTAPITEGERVYFVGHSFHMFIVRPLIYLAREAGVSGHWAEGWDMIGGSTPMQHWERNGDDNEVKEALKTGRVQALTLASNVVVPEPAIDLFADMAIEHNPDVRVLVQHSWGDAATGIIMRARHAGKTEPASIPTNEERDQTTAEELAASRLSNNAQRDKLAAQLEDINERHGRLAAFLVPVSDLVIRLRQTVVAGDMPGVARQSELFRDPLGHATQPTMDAVCYAWLAALYRHNPTGLTALVDPDDPTSADRQRVLQELAWQAVLEDPLSGLVPSRG